MSLSLMYMPNFKEGKEKNMKGCTWKKITVGIFRAFDNMRDIKDI